MNCDKHRTIFKTPFSAARPNYNTGFTLIEVMVVVVILGILAAIIVPKIMDRPELARITKAKSDIRALQSALDLYRLDNYSYPSTDQGLESLVQRPSSAKQWKEGGYIDRLPNDPWGHPYQYMNPGAHGTVDIWSLGSGQQNGGDSVIGNWTLE